MKKLLIALALVAVRPQSIWDISEPKLREYFPLRIEAHRPQALSAQVPLSAVL